jgi:hypothetical protein
MGLDLGSIWELRLGIGAGAAWAEHTMRQKKRVDEERCRQCLFFFLPVQGWVDGHAAGAGGLLPKRVEESEASWDDFFFFFII